MTLVRDADTDTKGALVTRHSLREARLNLNILLAEDNRVNQQLALHILDRFGHKVRLVTTGVEVVEAWEGETFDVILMDIQMPVMDGYAATKAIRQWQDGIGIGPTPILALTAFVMKEEVQKCLAAGCTAHLGKPIKKAQLLDAIYKYAKYA